MFLGVSRLSIIVELICGGGFLKWTHHYVIYAVILLSDILGMVMYFVKTLAANVINMGAPLISNAFKCKHHRRNVVKIKEDGVVDTLRVLLHSHDYGLRHSRPHTLVTLLTRFLNIIFCHLHITF